MTAHSTIPDFNVIPAELQIVAEASEPKATGLLERIEAALCKYFGEDEETIANSLRGL